MTYTRVNWAAASAREGVAPTAKQMGDIDRALFDQDARITTVEGALGTATVANGATTVLVPHGLGAAPSLSGITVTPTNSMGTATKFFASAPDATNFSITVNADPGATTATFAWSARLP